MKNVTVYRVDYVNRTRVPIGSVIERRKRDRGDNLIGLLRLAKKTYASTPEDAFHIVIDWDEARTV